MGELDKEFMLNMERVRDLLPQIKSKLDAVQLLPDDLDEPIDQQEVDALLIYSGAVHLMARRLLKLAERMMVSSPVQRRLNEKQREAMEEYEPGSRDMYEETGHTRADF